MGIVRRTIMIIAIAACLGVVAFSTVAIAHGGKKMEPLYDIKEAGELASKTFKIGGLFGGYNHISIFPVPQDNAVGSNDMGNAITIISFPKGKIDYDKYFRNAKDISGSGKYMPPISQDLIGFGQVRVFHLFDFKKKLHREYRIVFPVTQYIEKIAIADAKSRHFLFEIESQKENPKNALDVDISLQLVDLSGEKPILIKEIKEKPGTVMITAKDRVFIYHIKTKRLETLDMNFEPAHHPLEKVLKQYKDQLKFPVPNIIHPHLPLAILPGNTLISWNENGDNTPHRLFGKRTNAYKFSFSPDGKWVSFTNSYKLDIERTYIMPVSEKYPHYVGSPILLSNDSFETGQWAWTTNPTAFIGTKLDKIYRWDLENREYPGKSKISFHEYIVKQDLENIKLKQAEGSPIDKIKRLIDSKTDLDAKDESDYGYTVLMKAADDGDADIVKLLISAHANLNVTNTYGQTAFTVAARAGHIDTLKLLMTPTSSLDVALSEAVEGGHVDLVKFLINTKANVDLRRSYGKTPLMEAVESCREDIVKLLIDAKADVNMVNDGGTPVIAMAVEKGDVNIAKLLINAKADVNVSIFLEQTPLIIAVKNNNFEMAKILIDAKADVNAFSNRALETAIERSYVDLVKLLIDSKANVSRLRVDFIDNLKMLKKWRHEDTEKLDDIKKLIENARSK